MRTGLDVVQYELLDANDKIDVSWLFEIDLDDTGSVDHYFSTKVKNPQYENQDYLAKIIDFSSIKMAYTGVSTGLQSPADITIKITNKDQNYTASDFKDAYIVVKLVIKAELKVDPTIKAEVAASSDIAFETSNICEAVIMSWGFKCKRAWDEYQVLNLYCVDWLQTYLEGDYPNTALINDLFPLTNMTEDNMCIADIYGNPYFPVRFGIKSGYADGFYIVGPYTPGVTHSITKHRAPDDYGGTEFTFPTTGISATQGYTNGSDGNNVSIVELNIVNPDSSNEAQSNVYYGPDSGPFEDVNIKVSKSTTEDDTNPIEVIYKVLQEFGIATSKINTEAYQIAKSTMAVRGVSWDTPLYYKQDKKKLLAKMLAMCNTRIIQRDQLYFKVNSNSSQHAVTKEWVLNPNGVGEGMFSCSPCVSQEKKDSGYVQYRESGKPITSLVKTVVPVKSSTDYISSTVIEAEYISNSEIAQRVAKFELQRQLMRSLNVSCTCKGKSMQIECGDMITFEPTDYGGSFNALVTNMSLTRDLSVSITAIKFTEDLDNWEDIEANGVTPQGNPSGSGQVKTVVKAEATPSGIAELNTLIMSEITGTLADISGTLDDISNGASYAKVALSAVNATAKVLLSQAAGDLDDIANGTYGKVLTTDISSGHIVLSACTGDLDDVSDGSSYGKVALTDISSGHIVLSTCTGNLDDISDGSSYGRIAITDISSGHIVLSTCTGDLDDISDGSSYGKIALTDISSGHILLSTCTGDLDDVSDGSSYGKVALTDISSGHILLSTCTGDLDDVSDGSSYGKVALTDISSGHILLSTCTGDLDDISDGSTYDRVLATSISSGKILLTSAQSVAGATLTADSSVFLASDWGLVMKNGDGNIRASITPAGTFFFGDYDNDEGISYDGTDLNIFITAGKVRIYGSNGLQIKSGATGNIEDGGNLIVEDGGDIEIESGGDINIQSGGDINIASGGNINIASGGNINVASGGDIHINSGADIEIESGGNIDVNAGGDITVNSGGTCTIGDYSGGKGLYWDTSNLNIKGSLIVDGDFLSNTSTGAKCVEINSTNNEIYFYGDQGDSSIEKLVSIGIINDSDYFLMDIGRNDSGYDRIGMRIRCYNGDGLRIISYNSGTPLSLTGGTTSALEVISGTSTSVAVFKSGGTAGATILDIDDSTSYRPDYGIYINSNNLYYGKGPIRLKASNSSSKPSHSAALGTLWVSSTGVLYINTNGSTTWAAVGDQSEP